MAVVDRDFAHLLPHSAVPTAAVPNRAQSAHTRPRASRLYVAAHIHCPLVKADLVVVCGTVWLLLLHCGTPFEVVDPRQVLVTKFFSHVGS